MEVNWQLIYRWGPEMPLNKPVGWASERPRESVKVMMMMVMMMVMMMIHWACRIMAIL